jgi:hypothetical protein
MLSPLPTVLPGFAIFVGPGSEESDARALKTTFYFTIAGRNFEVELE